MVQCSTAQITNRYKDNIVDIYNVDAVVVKQY